MIQDNQLFEDINSLPPKEKAEVIDLVKRLKSKNVAIEEAAPSHQSILDVIKQAPGHLIFKSAEEVDAYIASERDEWDN